MLLPTANTALNNDIRTVDLSSFTFWLDFENNISVGCVDGREAVTQAIYLILSIERYRYVILPRSYGIETEDLFGMPVPWVILELERRIRDALLQDSRILSVDSFEFYSDRNKVLSAFTCHTKFGSVDAEKEVVI